MIALHASALSELLGWAAALLTLCTFVCGDMRRLRMIALAANASFIAYGLYAQLMPVLALHLVLVPVNLWRLMHALRQNAPRPGVTAAIEAGPQPAADADAPTARDARPMPAARARVCTASERRQAASRRAAPGRIPGYRAPRPGSPARSPFWLPETQP
ncbi:MAG TPA: hypothetical protein VFK82_06345 [Burkholderiaceae bacterium]|nr:hypothetical protein [Burkholderiaceae bacterium]